MTNEDTKAAQVEDERLAHAFDVSEAKRPWRQKALETASTFTGVHWVIVATVLAMVAFATTCGICQFVIKGAE